MPYILWNRNQLVPCLVGMSCVTDAQTWLQIRLKTAILFLRAPGRKLSTDEIKLTCRGLRDFQPCLHVQDVSSERYGSLTKTTATGDATEFFFARVPPSVTYEELLEVFERYGAVEHLNLFR